MKWVITREVRLDNAVNKQCQFPSPMKDIKGTFSKPVFKNPLTKSVKMQNKYVLLSMYYIYGFKLPVAGIRGQCSLIAIND